MRKPKYQEMGSRIRQARLNAGLKQKDCLVPLGDITVQMLSDWENGYVCPSLTYLINISVFFKISLDYLVLGKTDPAADSTICSYKDAIVYMISLNESGLFDLTCNFRDYDYIVKMNSKDSRLVSFMQEYTKIRAASKSLRRELYEQAVEELVDKYDIPYKQ